METSKTDLDLETSHLLITIVEEQRELPEPEESFKTKIQECNKSSLIKQRESLFMKCGSFK